MSGQRSRAPRRADLSQHFLRSGARAASLVQQASVSDDDVVVEIGAGRGMLTAALSTRCRSVIAVEVDARLCAELRARFARDAAVAVVHGDFLRFTLPTGPYKVVGNIPYSRSADIVRRLTGAPTPPTDAYLIVQREAGRRFAGTPFGPETRVSLLLKPTWHVEIVSHLRRDDFDPAPRVESVVLWLARRGRPLVADAQLGAYRSFVGRCFGRSGRTVGRCLRPVFTRRQIHRLARDLRFDPSAPPSALTFGQWLGLFRFHASRAEPS